MSTYSEVDEPKLSLTEMPDEILKKVRRSVGLIGNTQKADIFLGQVTEKRSRREIANCNERRRMQSINSGFESLKELLPTEDGEKLSKAAILQLTSKYIQHLVGENRRMREQLSQLQQQAQPQQQRQADVLLTTSEGANRKRKIGAGIDSVSGSGSLYIGFTQQQVPSIPTTRIQQQPQATFQLSVKPDYEQFVIEPAAIQIPQSQKLLSQSQAQLKPKRLEHLMMAIERIEGKSQEYAPHPISSSPDRASSALECRDIEDRSPQLLNRHQTPQPAIMISPFTPHYDQQHQKLDSDANGAASASQLVLELADGSQLCRPRAIPHKYLHRPQVVQANRSN